MVLRRILDPNLVAYLWFSLLLLLRPSGAWAFLQPLRAEERVRVTTFDLIHQRIEINQKRSQKKLPPTALSASPEIMAAGAVLGFAGWLFIDGAEDRAWRRQREEEDARYQEYQNQRAQEAYIEPREYWAEEDLRPYDGTQEDGSGPILLAADGWVFNVYKGRNFYGPGAEYHIMAGRDATRLLARTRLEEETPQEAAKPLTLAERAALQGWMFTLKNKYDIVGKLEGFDPSTTAMT